MIIYRAVGKTEYELIKESGFKAIPPRLPSQPILYLEANVKYARKIACEWNTLDESSSFMGIVLSIEVDDIYMSNYKIEQVGGDLDVEYWIPSERVEEFNASVKNIKVVEIYDQYMKLDPVYYMPLFETPRLFLKPVTIQDAPDLFEYASDVETTLHVSFDPHKNIQDTYAFLERAFSWYKEKNFFNYGIYDKETNKLIGMGGYSYDPHCVNLGYILNKKYWGRGIMVEACSAIIDFGFKNLLIHRIGAYHSHANPKSGRVMEKLGMTKEGVMKDGIFSKGSYYDHVQYGLINPNKKSA